MGVQAAVKTFRDTSKESAFKEIEMTFSLRHPNVVGMYAWFRRDRSGEDLQIGWVAWRDDGAKVPPARLTIHTPNLVTLNRMVMELAAGDLRGFYAKPTGGKNDTYTFRSGQMVVVGAAKGLAYMHSMPSPVLHRDIKSGNIMVMKDGIGKVGDCGESRRIVSV